MYDQIDLTATAPRAHAGKQTVARILGLVRGDPPSPEVIALTPEAVFRVKKVGTLVKPAKPAPAVKPVRNSGSKKAAGKKGEKTADAGEAEAVKPAPKPVKPETVTTKATKVDPGLYLIVNVSAEGEAVRTYSLVLRGADGYEELDCDYADAKTVAARLDRKETIEGIVAVGDSGWAFLPEPPPSEPAASGKTGQTGKTVAPAEPTVPPPPVAVPTRPAVVTPEAADLTPDQRAVYDTFRQSLARFAGPEARAILTKLLADLQPPLRLVLAS